MKQIQSTLKMGFKKTCIFKHKSQNRFHFSSVETKRIARNYF